MVSIFRDYYIKNSERLEGSAEKKLVKKSPDQGFENVLADIDKSRNNRALYAKKNQNEEANNSNENSHARGRLAPPNPVVFIEPKTEFSSNQSLTTAKITDNLSNQSVNGLTPSNQISQAGRPEIPQIIYAGIVADNAEVDMQHVSLGDSLSGEIFEGDEIRDIIVKAGLHHGIDPELSLAVAQAESSFVHTAVSSDGHASKGLFQLLDSTGRHLMDVHDIEEKYKPFDPGQNAFLGVGYLRRLMDLFSSSNNLTNGTTTKPVNSADELEKFALAAFNAGEGSVARAQETAARQGKDAANYESIAPFLPVSTRRYVDRVRKFREQFALANSESEVS